jgi:hypothetical protein
MVFGYILDYRQGVPNSVLSLYQTRYPSRRGERAVSIIAAAIFEWLKSLLKRDFENT